MGNISQTDFGYTGQRALDNGLMDYHARFYDAYLNRWTQPDSIIPNAANPQSLNRFSYGLNNPVKYTDPSGHKPCWATRKYSCELNQNTVDTEYAKYNVNDQPAVAKFFQSQGWQVGVNSGGGSKPYYLITPPPPTPTLPPPSICEAGQTCYDTNPPSGYYIAGYRTYHEWADLDWWDVGVNVLGIVGAGVLLASTVGVVSVAPAAAFYEVTQAIGITYDATKFNLGQVTVDSVLEVVSQFKEWGRIAPPIGVIVNGVNIMNDIRMIERKAPIYEPYPSPFPSP